MIVKGHAGRNDIQHHRAAVRHRRFQHGQQLAFVAGKRASHKRRARLNRQRAGIERRQVIDDPGFQLRTDIGGGGKLSFGEAIHAVVFDDVDHRQIAPHEVDELTHADGGGIAIAAYAQGKKSPIRQHRAGGDRRHAPVHAVEAVSAAQKIGRRFRRASDAAHLDDSLGLDAHLKHGVNDPLGNNVVAATGAQGGLAAFVFHNAQAKAISFLRGWYGGHIRGLPGR